ncbi:MAG: NADH-quinone oxidoreductase subunit N [Deltaproteobacteria bacterium]|nr:NADH-quinone oxidoreductase subunit N [Deltaproteobacteria bacterium]
MDFTIPDVNFISFAPEVILLLFATILLFVQSGSGRRGVCALLAFLALVSNILMTPFYWGKGIEGFGGLIIRDNFSIMCQTMIIVAVILVIVYSYQYLVFEEKNLGEYYTLLLTSVVGMNIMIASTNLMVIFMGMEILSMSLYVLVAFFKTVREGMEASIKYFLLGAFASAIFLLGISFFYGASGKTGLDAFVMFDATSKLTVPFFFVGISLIMVGLGFKIASVPFHMWAPDAYEGAPTSVASFLSVAPKIAGMAVIFRVGIEMSKYFPEVMLTIIAFMAVTSMIVGNFAAMRQSGLVRMLAYSGIAQVGYMMISLLAIPQGGGSALLFYLSIYVLMNMGAFGIAVLLSKKKDKRVQINDLKGLAGEHPVIAFTMAVFMLSLAGIPPTGGFFAKFYVFTHGIEAGYLWVVIIAVITTVASLYYYFRVIVFMYMTEEEAGILPKNIGINLFNFALIVAALLIIVLGVIPGSLLELAQQAVVF